MTQLLRFTAQLKTRPFEPLGRVPCTNPPAQDDKLKMSSATVGWGTRSSCRKITAPMEAGRRASGYWYYGLLLLVVVFFGLIRWHLRNVPLERDEGEYAYAGQLMLHGVAPYTSLYSMKLPGTFAAYARSSPSSDKPSRAFISACC